MLFNSQAFVLLFLPPVLAGYYTLAGSAAARHALLIAASLLFYGFWDPRFVPPLAALTVLNWLVGRAWMRTGRRWVLDAGIAGNLALLGVFKYADFFTSQVAWLLGGGIAPLGIILPLGISFFTFQKIGYLIDLRRGARPVYGLLEFSAFVTFFPQLIAGPLVRHNEVIPQLLADPRGEAMWENLVRGLALFTIGLAKKAGLADTVALVCDPLYARAAAGQALTAAEAWAAAGTFALQIYFDFSGYSDMAIGLGLMFGLRLPLNFAAPYRARSIGEFWRRWHMTLSRFLRDYVFLPLSNLRIAGMRHPMTRYVVATMGTMTLCGFWHGARWTFVLWGALQGVAMVVAFGWGRVVGAPPRPVGWALTLLFVLAGLVLFRSPDFTTAARVLVGMAGLEGLGRMHVDNAAVVAAAAAVALLGPTSQEVALERLRPVPWIAPTVGAALVFLLLLIGGRVPSEFIYFQF